MWSEPDFKPEIQIKLEFDIPTQINHTAILAWIGHLRPHPDLPYEPLAGFDPQQDVARSYMRLYFEFVATLFQVCKVPVYDSPELVELEKSATSENRYTSKFLLNGMPSFPMGLYEQAYKVGAHCTLWANDHDINATNREVLYGYLQANLIKPLSALVFSGKSTEPMLRIANRLGIPFIYLGMGIYQVGWASKSRRLYRSVTDGDSAIGSKLSNHKVTTANVLRMAGLPTPLQRTFRTLNEIKSALDQLPYPVVIKPTDCERGEGVTVDIKSPEEVAIAFEAALAASTEKQVLVEKQIPGICHRFLIACGSLLYAVRRNPISVIGDGIRTVEQLVLDECAIQGGLAPWNRSEIKPLDAEALLCLKLAGFNRDTIPMAGVRVPLRRIESTHNGGIDDDVTEVAHPENIALALQAAKLLGLEVAGIDIISTDISRPWHENDAVINEVNFAPLLGGAPISRSYLPKFFSRLIDADGRITIDVYDDEQTALEAFSSKLANGLRCYYTSEQQTLNNRHEEVTLCCSTLDARIFALLCRTDVDAIVVWRPKREDIGPSDGQT